MGAKQKCYMWKYYLEHIMLFVVSLILRVQSSKEYGLNIVKTAKQQIHASNQPKPTGLELPRSMFISTCYTFEYIHLHTPTKYKARK